MGTDIHLELERYGEDGIWHRIEHPDLPCDNPLCDSGVYSSETPNEKMHGKPCYACKGEGHYVRSFYGDRNYDVFGILADVRNGAGFAGVDTGDGFVPVDTPRGLPDDLSAEIRAALDRAGDEDYWDDPQHVYLGDHSFSWLLVQELLDYDWDRTTKKRGWVDPWQFEIWRRDGKPQMWSGGISGQSIEHITPQAMERMIDSGDLVFEGEDDDWASGRGYDRRPYSTSLQRSMQDWGLPVGSVGQKIATDADRYYTCVEWEVGYRESAAGFLTALERDIVPLGPPESLRLVFGFDS